MKSLPKRKQLPYYDSHLELEFGNFDKLDNTLQGEWIEEIKRMRGIRSNFIVDGYQVERVLTEVLALAFFPSPDDEKPNLKLALGAGRETFQELVLNDMRLYSKIRLFKLLRDRSPFIKANTKTNLIRRLDQIRDIRNQFAHYPVRFDVKGKPPHHTWSPILVCKDKEIVLTSDYIFRCSMRSTEVSSELVKLLVALRKHLA
jgi:hypothetical protein